MDVPKVQVGTCIVPERDGLRMRQSRRWATMKLDYLERYIDIFTTAMRDKWWLNYIDLFAGPGKCWIRESRTVCLGSPLLALTAKHPFSGYYFVDLSSRNTIALQRRCAESPLSSRVRYFTADANVAVRSIVQQIQAMDREPPPGRGKTLNLAFLDPQGLQLDWETVAALSMVRRMDLVIHFSDMGLQRYMPVAARAEEETRADRFFGDVGWREVYARSRHKLRDVIDFYRDRLGLLGYVEIANAEEIHVGTVMHNRRNRGLYRLLFASKHQRGNEFWQKVARKDVDGQMRLALDCI